MSLSPSTSKMLSLKSSDGKVLEVEEHVAVLCETIKSLVEDGCADSPIPLANVDGATLGNVMEWCKKHADQEASADDLKDWDAEFVERDQGELYHLIMAANYLNIKGLLDLICQKVADMIKGKHPEKIREIFNIENDFTSEQQEQIRKDNSWAFE
ncbi:hypothetical protein L1049_010926 [Liquidambar formosana]|uniref:SKP1-like protein n=1 Tax=Liquidambar formosana TaxID=63359 RepID=A0AAP0RVX9_LIQFO